MVKQIERKFAFEEALNGAGNKLVVDFSATRCGPCKMIELFFHDVVSDYEVKCMPTFQFLKNGQKRAEFS
ncbi:thioredoxin-like isoform 2-T2 [Hipposideros larvatus]